MVFSMFDVIYITIGALLVIKYFRSNNNIKKINNLSVKYNDGDKILLYYDECKENCIMDYNYDIKYEILRDYDKTNYTFTKDNEIEVVYI
jgi:hypothetical protein